MSAVAFQYYTIFHYRLLDHNCKEDFLIPRSAADLHWQEYTLLYKNYP